MISGIVFFASFFPLGAKPGAQILGVGSSAGVVGLGREVIALKGDSDRPADYVQVSTDVDTSLPKPLS